MPKKTKQIEIDHEEEEEETINASSIKEPMVAYLEACMLAVDVNQNDPDELERIRQGIEADRQVMYAVVNTAANLVSAAKAKQTGTKTVADAIILRKTKGVAK